MSPRPETRPDNQWIQTYTRQRFWPLDPRPEDVDIHDIAHALSLVCRFTGHVKQFYSVAEHSLAVSRRCKPEDALWGLLHDASEAYLCDLSSPVKRNPLMVDYRNAERELQACICERFGLPLGMPASVQEADLRMLRTEQRDLMPGGRMKEDPIPVGQEPYEDRCYWPSGTPSQIKKQFLVRFNDLYHHVDVPVVPAEPGDGEEEDTI